MKRLATALLLAALVGVGCTSDEPAATPAATDAPVASESTADRPQGKRRPVVLEAETIVLAVDDMTTNDLRFGETDAATAKRELDERLGVSGDEEDLTDCGDGSSHVITYPGLGVYFSNDELVGWHVRSVDTSGLTTATGISLASTRQEVEDAYDDKVEVRESTLGTEWTAPDGISGLFEDDSQGAEVETFWSGRVCIAR